MFFFEFLVFHDNLNFCFPDFQKLLCISLSIFNYVKFYGFIASASEQLETPRGSSDEENEMEKSNAGDTQHTDEREDSTSRRRRRISDVADSVGRREAKRRRRMERKRHREDVLWKYHENSWYGPSVSSLF